MDHFNSDKLNGELQEIFKTEFNIDISLEEAKDMRKSLLKLFKALVKISSTPDILTPDDFQAYDS